MRAAGYCKQTVVPLGLTFTFLLDLKNADDAAGQHKARKSRRVVDDHDVERIAVIGFGRWDEAPVVGIGQAGEERFGEGESFEFRVVRKFCAAATRRFDDDMHVAAFRKGREVNEIRHGGASPEFDQLLSNDNLRS